MALLLGLWIALAPFSRPLPGGATFSLEATPRFGCQTPVVGMIGNDQPSADVYTAPRPQAGDPTVIREVDCTWQARFRVAIGTAILAAGFLLLATIRRRGNEAPTEPSD